MACFYSAPLAWNPTGVDKPVRNGADRFAAVDFGDCGPRPLQALRDDIGMQATCLGECGE